MLNLKAQPSYCLIQRNWVLVGTVCLILFIVEHMVIGPQLFAALSSQRPRALHEAAVSVNFQPFSPDTFTNNRTRLYGLSHLIVVAGHAVLRRHDAAQLNRDSAWFLEPYQTGMAALFVKHIQRAVTIAAQDSNALLLFSGGQTRPAAGPRSEAVSYWLVAELARWFDLNDSTAMSVANRSLTEEFARDSFENLLFSVCRFHELTGNYPRSISVVGFGFKKRRFVELHRRAIRYPESRFHYEGLDPTFLSDTGKSTAQLAQSELEFAFRDFTADLYGCEKRLAKKKINRNTFRRTHGYVNSCPELRELFSYCGPHLFAGDLPWDNWV